jgi:DNA repair protein RadC
MPATQKKITRLNYREDWTPTDHALATLLDVRRIPGDVTPSQLVLGETFEHLPGPLCAKINALHELVRSRIGRIAPLSGMLLSSVDVADYFRADIGHDRTESFWMLTLDAKNRVRGTHCIARGDRSSCPVPVGRVLRVAILEAASAILLIHNHPSGCCSPSPEDLALTGRIREAAQAVDVRLLDHLIVTSEAYCSFLDLGVL